MSTLPSINFVFLYLLFISLEFAIDLILELRQLKRNLNQNKLPAHVDKFATLEEFQKAQSYNYDKRVFSIITSILSFGIISIGYFLYIFPWIFNWALTIPTDIIWYNGEALISQNSEYVISIYWLILISLSTKIYEIPIALYSDFVVEEKHGFNKKTIGLFFSDLLKGEFLSIIFTIILTPPTIYFATSGTSYEMVFYLFVFTEVVIFLFMFIYPNWIQPLFNKYEPLEDVELREKIEALAAEHDFPLTKLYQVDGSKRSSHSNAYFFGFWKNKRIVLFDTLLKHSHDEILAVLCHEIGHWYHSHLIWNLLFASIHIFLLYAGFAVFLIAYATDITSQFGYATPYVIVLLMLFTKMWSPVEFLFSRFMIVHSRKCEFQADEFAVKCGRGKELLKALVHLQVDNLGEMDPDTWYSWFHYSHPPMAERMSAIEELMDHKETGHLSEKLLIESTHEKSPLRNRHTPAE